MHRLRKFLSALKPTRLGVLFAVLAGLGVGFWQWRPGPRLVLQIPGRLQPDTLAVDSQTVYFSPDGRTLAIFHHVGNPKNQPRHERQLSLNLWDANSGRKKRDLHLFHGSSIRGFAFSPDGHTVACRLDKIRVWEAASGKELATFPNHGPNWWALAFSPEARLLALRKHHVLWDVAENKIVKNFLLNGERVIAAGQNTVLVACKGDVVRIWDLATATLCAERKDIPTTIDRVEHPTPSAKLTSDRRFLIYRPDLGHEVFVFDMVKGEKHKFPGFVGNNTFTTHVALSPDGQTVAVGFLNTSTNIKPKQKSWWSWITDLGGQEIFSNNYVLVKVFPSGEEIIALDGCYSPVFSPDGQTLAVIAEDGTSLQLWDIRKPIGKILGLAGLAVVATLLAFKGFGRLRRRKIKTAAMPAPQ